MKPCLNCQKNYEPKRETSKFCSTKCRVGYSRKHPKKAPVSTVQVQVLYNEVLEMLGKIKEGGQVVAAVQKTPFQSPLIPQSVPRVSQEAIMHKYVEDRRECTCQDDYMAWLQKLEADTRISTKQKELVKNTH